VSILIPHAALVRFFDHLRNYFFLPTAVFFMGYHAPRSCPHRTRMLITMSCLSNVPHARSEQQDPTRPGVPTPNGTDSMAVPRAKAQPVPLLFFSFRNPYISCDALVRIQSQKENTGSSTRSRHGYLLIARAPHALGCSQIHVPRTSSKEPQVPKSPSNTRVPPSRR
jgi:hypothetical protein